MRNQKRVGIVAHRFACPGGIQTCFIELILGLNEIGIVPEIVWDEPQDWSALGNPDLQATVGGGQLGISSRTQRSLPLWLAARVRSLTFSHARLDLARYDFVYCFEPGVRMLPGVPNVCWLTGPSFLRLPGDQVDRRRLYRPREIKALLSHATWPLLKPDKHSHYVTHSDWIADLFLDRYHYRPPVIWPPVRSRVLPAGQPDRSGFLFLSRLEQYKRADSMLTLAGALPEQKITLAGVVLDENRTYVAHLRERIRQEGLSNIELVENPSEERVAHLLTSHEIFVFPAPWEHFGIVTVEAIQAGLLPLVHDTGGQQEIVPFESLRFLSDEQLIDRAHYALQMPDVARLGLVSDLRRHVERGSAEHYRAAMLQEIGLLPQSEY